jgi:hypothetical protein
MLAALHGFDACGIEIQRDLVEQARKLASDFSISAEFVVGSLIPECADVMVSQLDDVAYVDTNAPSGYAELGMDMDDFDLIYVFPWPGEEHFYERLFDKYAAAGALLLSYHGVEGVRLKRRQSR